MDAPINLTFVLISYINFFSLDVVFCFITPCLNVVNLLWNERAYKLCNMWLNVGVASIV